jgi:hypothetical protein
MPSCLHASGHESEFCSGMNVFPIRRYVIIDGRKPQSNDSYSSQIKINFETEQAKCLID